MSITDIERQKYVRLIARVEELEARVAELEDEIAFDKDSGQSQDGALVADELRAAQNKLAAARTELARVSDGCGKPHG
ncbi:MAG: hypothetical protein WC381_02745 [Kiritimatiellia bacterium]|jgi:cell division septum initiation protein DivIVA